MVHEKSGNEDVNCEADAVIEIMSSILLLITKHDTAQLACPLLTFVWTATQTVIKTLQSHMPQLL